MASDPLRTLFLHELSIMYDAELQLAAVLRRLADDTAQSDASDSFRAHIPETEQHAENLRRCFALLDTEPRRATNYAAQGLARDYDALAATHPPRDVLIAFALGAAAKTEHFEIASYIGLLRQAHMLGATDVAYFLAENLRVEQVTSKKVEVLADNLSRAVGRERGQDLEEFRWSYYTEMAVQTPVVVDGVQPSPLARPAQTPPAARRVGGLGAMTEPSKTRRPGDARR